MRYIKIVKNGFRTYAVVAGFICLSSVVGQYTRRKAMTIIREENKIKALNDFEFKRQELLISYKGQRESDKVYLIVLVVGVAGRDFINRLLTDIKDAHQDSFIQFVVFSDSKSISDSRFTVKAQSELPSLVTGQTVDNSVNALFLFKGNSQCLLKETVELSNPREAYLKVRAALKDDFDREFMRFYES